ncbi:hypothetical protein DI09_192p10 [Mitosporidium daphniae]|uniref:Anticodon-binding domain-containing protein n=1 Tax=Mitosporidium daphniae TaxID=1485682 RepID=A0A098VTH6_9MICR|nr:uncharacterized protein DI09_192p10 [Mitosporidium daphniae]KGG52282.1 hypothetical protein DI09_192p10 [Mitosporidium daphniae]|eukprot:XP_013238718.1 uncharacterized protein DI09_192p10 [Mitosporidium daphniae]
MQSSGSEKVCMTRVDHAIEKGIIDNSTLGYFLVRIYLFLLKIGLHPDIIRFRQHQSNEMAHYASDCWDAELLTSYGWIECVGCADRAAFDLTVHSLKTKEKLVVRERLSTPVTELRVVAELDRKAIGITFKKDAKLICDAIALAQEDPVLMEKILQESLDRNKVAVPLAGWNSERSSASCPSDFVEVPSQMLGLRKELTTTHVREYTPAVIEPSFGIGRIIYALLEHCYWVRAQDEQRSVLSLAPLVAPTKVLIAPLLSQKSFEDLVSNIALLLKSKGIATQADCSSATVGKKYARADELGTPFAVTIDHQTVTEVQENIPATVTVRERDSTTQIRVFINDLPDLIENLVQGKLHWNNQLLSKYEVVQCSNC